MVVIHLTFIILIKDEDERFDAFMFFLWTFLANRPVISEAVQQRPDKTISMVGS